MQSVRPSSSTFSAGQAPVEESAPSATKPTRAQPAAEQGGRRQELQPWAHAAVHESFTDAKMRSSAWAAYGFRIAPDVLARLKERLNADRTSSGNRQLAIGHYLDAALRKVSGGVEEWIDLATDFATERLWDAAATQPSSYRVGREAHEWVSGLSNALQAAEFGRRGTLVVSALVERILDSLEAEGPLTRPERRRRG
ncbi:hypothetical protein [Streptomyces sp. NPDC056663]|uniref:hypothetical protein n=1 Tax=Streptomyces sp. NPDC056663 TaxID=3345899 RepID=UPI00369C16B1